MSNLMENRPLKFGSKNQQVAIIGEDEISLRLAYNKDGLVEYVGKAKIGSKEDSPVWQIRKLVYDNNNLISVEWPILSKENIPSANYSFLWKNREQLTYK